MLKKVLVTGGCGFLGSHVCEYYRQQGAEVVAYDNMTKMELARTGLAVESTRNFNKDELERLGVQVVREDVRNFEALADHAAGVDYIVHTAAQPAMTISWEEPRLDLATNVIGTFNALEVARQRHIPVASCATIHIYGNQLNDGLVRVDQQYVRPNRDVDETHPLLEGTLTPLHASKAAADAYVRAYIDTFKVEAASFRLSGIYGTRQFGGEDHGWVANFVIRAVMGWPITLFGTGAQVRDIVYATDVCRVFDAFYRFRKPGVYNIGGGTATKTSLLECIALIEASTGVKPTVQFQPQRHGDLLHFVCDIRKAAEALEWRPEIMPRQGISRLIAWTQQNRGVFGNAST